MRQLLKRFGSYQAFYTNACANIVIISQWYPEVNLYAAGVPQLLVGTKYDMREEGIKDPHMDTLEAVDSEKV